MARWALSSTNFKGKAAVYYRNSGPYFVVNFTCSSGQLSGNWTFDTSDASYSGTVDSGNCSFSGGSSSISNVTVSCGTANCRSATVGNLALLNISAAKTYVDNEYCPPPPNPLNPQCLVINASVTSTSGDTDTFASKTADMADYGTLTIQLPKS
jgi:hypothetical protein